MMKSLTSKHKLLSLTLYGIFSSYPQSYWAVLTLPTNLSITALSTQPLISAPTSPSDFSTNSSISSSRRNPYFRRASVWIFQIYLRPILSGGLISYWYSSLPLLKRASSISCGRFVVPMINMFSN